MFRNFFISIVITVMLSGCANMSIDEVNETAGMITTLMAEFGPGALLFIPFGIVAGIQQASEDQEIELQEKGEYRKSTCTIHACKVVGCTTYQASIRSDGTPDIDMNAVLKDTIAENSSHDCPI